MRLSFRLVVRNGIRRFQIAEPVERPGALRAARAHGARGGRRGGRRRAHLLDQPRAHARVLRRARRGGRRVAGHRPALPEGPGRPARPRTRCASCSRSSSPRSRRGRSSCTATARSGSARSPTSRACARASARSTRRSRPSPAARRTRPPRRPCATSRPRATRTASTSRRSRRCRSTSARSRATRACRSAPRAEYDAAYYRHQMPGGMVTTTRRMLAELRPARAVRRDARGGHARARGDGLPDHGHARLAVRGHAGHDERRSPASAGATSPTRWCATSSATSTSRPRPWTRTWPSACCRCRAPTSCATSSRSASRARASASARRISEEELLLRLTMPEEQVDAMVAGRGEPRRRRCARPGRDPLVRLLGELAKRDSISLPAAGEGRRPGGVAPCGLTTCAASCSTSTARSSTATSDFRARSRCRAPSRCWRRSARRAGRSCCSRTAATWAPRRSPRGLREDGLPVADDEVLTPVCSALSYLARRHPGRPVMVFGVGRHARAHGGRRRAARGRRGGRGRVRGARRRRRPGRRWSAPRARWPAARRLLTANYQRGYWGANGIDLQPRRDGDRRDRAGHGRAPDRRRQAVARRGATRSSSGSACPRSRSR